VITATFSFTLIAVSFFSWCGSKSGGATSAAALRPARPR
jgi:hypothetical protein